MPRITVEHRLTSLSGLRVVAPIAFFRFGFECCDTFAAVSRSDHHLKKAAIVEGPVSTYQCASRALVILLAHL